MLLLDGLEIFDEDEEIATDDFLADRTAPDHLAKALAPDGHLPTAMRPLPGSVAYLRPADKYLGPLVSRLSSVNQLVISTRNAFSTPRPTPLACV